MHDSHLLINKAFTYAKRQELSDPENCRYNEILGFWLWGNDKAPLVKSNNPDLPKPGTKKEDIETGEDLKGE